MEFFMRAIVGQIIIADPRSPVMQKQLKLQGKYRESFRRFALSALREELSEWFEHGADSPDTLFVSNVQIHKRRSVTEE